MAFTIAYKQTEYAMTGDSALNVWTPAISISKSMVKQNNNAGRFKKSITSLKVFTLKGVHIIHR
jgi:hypothetical protein